MWGIIPAAGIGSRIQPLAFSKELLPVGSRLDGNIERPKAVSEYLIERMIAGGAERICFVISPGKSDILEYYGSGINHTRFCYTIQQTAGGLCDAVFCAMPFIGPGEQVIIGLPDTIWFPEDALLSLPDDKFTFLLFPVENPEFFDTVVLDKDNMIRKILVKQLNSESNWIWGAFKLPVKILNELYELWCERNKSDEYIGTLVNAYIRLGGKVEGIKKGLSYVDVGTINGYREAMKLLYTKSEI
jgi:dTDP-glucose pyrophosphorylase